MRPLPNLVLKWLTVSEQAVRSAIRASTISVCAVPTARAPCATAPSPVRAWRASSPFDLADMHLDIGRPDPREPPQRADEGDGVGRTFCRIALHARGDAVLIEVGTTGRFGDQMIAGAFSDAHRVLGARPGDADAAVEAHRRASAIAPCLVL